MQPFRSWIPVFVLVCASLPVPAQNAAAAGSGAVRQVTLGNSTVPLGGLWKFHTGDNMAWAQPEFDDSGWGTMDLTPPPGSYDPTLGSSGFVPGWTTRGYPGYSGFAWYRLQVNIQGHQSALALKMPDNFDDAYQVYVNGQLVGEFGRFTAHGVTEYIAQPRAFPLPANLRSGAMTIAIRMWMAQFTALVEPDVGGLHGPPVLGQAAAIAGLLRLDWDAYNRSNYAWFFQVAIQTFVLLVAFALFWLDRTEPAYLWLGLTCAAILALVVLNVLGFESTWIDGNAVFFFTDSVLRPIVCGLWVIFWAAWFRLGRMARLHRIVWSAVVLWGPSIAMLRPPLYGSVVPVHASVWLVPLTDGLNALLGVLLLWVAVRGIRKNKAEGWLALPALLVVAYERYAPALFHFLHVPGIFFIFGIAYSFADVGVLVSLIAITLLLLRRFLHTQHEREQWKQEIEQARQVQQMLIPEALPVVPGLTLESEYRPAHRVGGDFFQIIPDRSHDGVLIVVGDVTGHGLQAAMLVSLLVGAIRAEAAHSADPLALLQSLNQRLLGRNNAQATCLALRITRDGECTLANAGHLPPYLNGKEMTMEGAVPMGMLDAAEFSVMQFHLQPGDRLTLLTDGVVEAQNANKELLGFERTAALVQTNQSAASIADAAQNFGQQDDITVVSVSRAMDMAERTSGEPALAAG